MTVFLDWLSAENKPTLICNGCGRRAEPLERDVAMAILADIVDRFAELVHVNGDPSTATSASRCVSVAGAAERAASALSVLDRQLRRLSVLDGPSGIDLDDPSEAPRQEGATGCTTPSLFEAAARLGWTLKTLPEVCWHPPSAAGGSSAAELTWIALHQATHCLEDAQLLSGRAGEPEPAERTEEAQDGASGVSPMKGAE